MREAQKTDEICTFPPCPGTTQYRQAPGVVVLEMQYIVKHQGGARTRGKFSGASRQKNGTYCTKKGWPMINLIEIIIFGHLRHRPSTSEYFCR